MGLSVRRIRIAFGVRPWSIYCLLAIFRVVVLSCGVPVGPPFVRSPFSPSALSFWRACNHHHHHAHSLRKLSPRWGAHWGAPLNYWCNGTMMFEGFLNRAPIMLRDASLSDGCSSICSWQKKMFFFTIKMSEVLWRFSVCNRKSNEIFTHFYFVKNYIFFFIFERWGK